MESLCGTHGEDIIFPGAEIRSPKSAWYNGGRVKGTHLSDVWIAVCIRYEDLGHVVHHSKYVYYASPTAGKAVAASPEHPEWTYFPLNNLSLIYTEAD